MARIGGASSRKAGRPAGRPQAAARQRASPQQHSPCHLLPPLPPLPPWRFLPPYLVPYLVPNLVLPRPFCRWAGGEAGRRTLLAGQRATAVCILHRSSGPQLVARHRMHAAPTLRSMRTKLLPHPLFTLSVLPLALPLPLPPAASAAFEWVCLLSRTTFRPSAVRWKVAAGAAAAGGWARPGSGFAASAGQTVKVAQANAGSGGGLHCWCCCCCCRGGWRGAAGRGSAALAVAGSSSSSASPSSSPAAAAAATAAGHPCSFCRSSSTRLGTRGSTLRFRNDAEAPPGARPAAAAADRHGCCSSSPVPASRSCVTPEGSLPTASSAPDSSAAWVAARSAAARSASAAAAVFIGRRKLDALLALLVLLLALENAGLEANDLEKALLPCAASCCCSVLGGSSALSCRKAAGSGSAHCAGATQAGSPSLSTASSSSSATRT